MRGERLFRVPQGGAGLLTLDHPVNFFNLTNQIRAAEFQLLAAAAGAHRVMIDCHKIIRNAAGSRIVRCAYLPKILADKPRFGDSVLLWLRQRNSRLAAHFQGRYVVSDLRLSPTNLSSAFCGSANLSSPSRISWSSIFCTFTFASISASTSAGGIWSTMRLNVRPLF